jgi:large subunit ribosomal protein L25
MPNARPTLIAKPREVTGKHVARLRRAGVLPAVVFGHGVESSSVQIDAHEFEQLRRHVGPNTLIDLTVDGGTAQPVLVHGVQTHPVTRRPLHIDLFAVRMTEEIVVDVPVFTIGIAPAVDMLNGTLTHVADHVRVRALPDKLPQSIEISVEGLSDFEAAIYVRDLPIPEGATLLSDPNEIVARVLPPRIEIEEVAPAAEEEGAEEAAAEGEAAGEGAESAAPSGPPPESETEG